MVDNEVEGFASGKVSEDGLTTTVTLKTKGGEVVTLVVPYMHLDWLIHTLTRMRMSGYENQVKAGRVLRLERGGAVMAAEGFRVVSSPDRHAMLQIQGRSERVEPQSKISLRIGAATLRPLAERLLEVAEQIQPLPAASSS